MRKVEIRKNEIWIDRKQRVPLLSGEVHYWRLNPTYWKEILSRVHEMGLRVISTYVPWDYHEYKRGRFDFIGKTDKTRNLKGFLELTRREGFRVIIRPGPYIYSEWPNDGVPDYAYKYHRLHPQFLKYAKNYLQRVLKVIQPYFASRRAGHIILLQADNEIDAWPDTFGYQYGLNGKPGLFQEFIRDLYHNQLDDLNQCWGTHYTSFDQAGPFIATMLHKESGLPLKGDHELKRNIDYFKFKYFYARKCAEWNVQAYRDMNVDIPIYLNLYPFFYAHDWAEMQAASDLVGVDLYPSSELAEDEFEQRKFIDKVRYLKSVSKIPFIAEFASGVWHARHYETGVLTPNHYRLITLSALLGGIAGWNWYMLVNRDNWYMSPINEWGRIRSELYEVFKQLVTIFNQTHPPSWKKISEVAVTFNPLQYAARTLTPNTPMIQMLYNADIDYELYDPRSAHCEKRFLFYSGNQWLEVKSQQNLRRYVEEGGTLIAFRDYPRKDDRFQPCSVVGFEDPQSILFEFKRNFSVQLAPSRPKVEMVSSVYCFDHVDADKIWADFGAYGRKAVGYMKNVGRGRLIHLGIEPTRDILLELMEYLKVPIGSRCVTKDIKTALFQRGKRFYLVATNNGAEDKSASVYLPALKSIRGKMTVKDFVSGKKTVCSYERRHPFIMDLPRKDGKVFEFKAL
ncbi:MAG: beta-galactosidase [Candidatus Omnitrophota bacterium]|jgi:beta-galactosidase